MGLLTAIISWFDSGDTRYVIQGPTPEDYAIAERVCEWIRQGKPFDPSYGWWRNIGRHLSAECLAEVDRKAGIGE